MTEKRFNYDYKTGRICDNESPVQNTKNPRHWVTRLNDIDSECKELKKEIEQLKRINKGQELEIVRLHNLADAMSGALRELGVYNVYDKQQIENRKKENE